MLVSALGSMAAEVAVMLVLLTCSIDNPRAYWLVIVGALCDSILGGKPTIPFVVLSNTVIGITTATIAGLAYVVDKTSVRNRSVTNIGQQCDFV